MPFTIAFNTTNAAFADDDDAAEGEADAAAALRREIARILRDVACKVEQGRDCGACVDVNGNSVGEWSL